MHFVATALVELPLDRFTLSMSMQLHLTMLIVIMTVFGLLPARMASFTRGSGASVR